MSKEVTWLSQVPAQDDFGVEITNEFIDGRIRNGTAWGLFAPTTWQAYGCGRLGQGYGQRYRLRSDDGKFVKVEG